MAPLPPLPSNFTRITAVKMWESQELKDGEVVVKIEWVGIDPAQRGWMSPVRSYVPPVRIGSPMRSVAVGRVALLPSATAPHTSPGSADSADTHARLQDSRGLDLNMGDWVEAVLSWSEYAKVPAKEVRKIHVDDHIPPTYHLGALGMSGQTAYWGLFSVLNPSPGETVVISGAAGAVGSLVCQLAKIHGCKVVAIAGGEDKGKWLQEEIGVDEVVDYKKDGFEKEFNDKVGYLDCYFDNVCGSILDLCLSRLNKGARIALCGAISAYNDRTPTGLQAYLNLIAQRAKMEGFIVLDYVSRFPEAEEILSSHLRAGRLELRETRINGLENAPQALCDLFKGKNVGKMVVRIGAEGAKL
ncbi:hypothetical protein JCM11641_003816 [Rhodosporidiobolus odoratus]